MFRPKKSTRPPTSRPNATPGLLLVSSHRVSPLVEMRFSDFTSTLVESPALGET